MGLNETIDNKVPGGFMVFFFSGKNFDNPNLFNRIQPMINSEEVYVVGGDENRLNILVSEEYENVINVEPDWDEYGSRAILSAIDSVLDKKPELTVLFWNKQDQIVKYVTQKCHELDLNFMVCYDV